MRKRTYGAEEARAHLPELLELAHHGTSTVITKHGKPYAAVVPVEQTGFQRVVSFLELRGTGTGLWGTDSRRTLRSMRGEWE